MTWHWLLYKFYVHLANTLLFLRQLDLAMQDDRENEVIQNLKENVSCNIIILPYFNSTSSSKYLFLGKRDNTKCNTVDLKWQPFETKDKHWTGSRMCLYIVSSVYIPLKVGGLMHLIFGFFQSIVFPHFQRRYFYFKCQNQDTVVFKNQSPLIRFWVKSVSTWVSYLTRFRRRLIAYSWLQTHSQGSKPPSAIFARPWNERKRLRNADTCKQVGKCNLSSVLCSIVVSQTRPWEREATAHSGTVSSLCEYATLLWLLF